MITLTAHDTLAEVSIFGGTLLRFNVKDAPVMRPTTEARVRHDVLQAACYPCTPYFGRITPSIVIDDTRHDLRATRNDIGVIHGHGWLAEWEILTQSEAALELGFTHAPAKGDWPLPFDARQRFELSPGALTISLSMTNRWDRPAPAGLALHPFFSKVPGTTITFTAAGFWTPPIHVPVGFVSARPDTLGTGHAAALPDDDRDHSYIDLTGDVLIDTPSGCTMLTTNAEHLHVFAPADEDFYCLEPTSHLPGKLLETPLLAPGATRKITMSISQA